MNRVQFSIITYTMFFLLTAIFEGKTQVFINEFLSSNLTTNVDSNDFYVTSDWIELFNAGPDTVDLTGYSVSDDATDPGKWVFPDLLKIPGNGYVLLWADGEDKLPGDSANRAFTYITDFVVNDCHLNFQLSSSGEEIRLFDAQLNCVDSVAFDMQVSDVSQGRSPSDGDQWLYFGVPTPGKANNASGVVTFSFCPKVTFSLPSGFYQGALSVELSAPPGTEIRYTTNGKKPTQSSTLYTSPISVFYSKQIQARIFESGKLPGPISTSIYLIGENIALPVISVSAEYGALWDFDFGIYNKSLKDLEIPANVKFFGEDKKQKFDVDAGIQLFGTNIFQLAQKPISVYMRSKYGDEAISAKIFEDKDITTFKNIVFRNGGNDNPITMIRDGLCTSLVKNKMDIDYQAFKPCVLYLNGNFWGIYHLREKMNDSYLESNYYTNPAEVDILEDSMVIMAGEALKYNEFLDFLSAHDLSDPANYAVVQSQMDINEYINYKILKIYIGYNLEYVNNKYWRPRSEDGKWRWMAFDMEHSFARLGGDSCHINTIEKITQSPGELPDWSTLIFRKLLENEEFKAEFIQRFGSFLNTLFVPENVISVIDSIQGLMAADMSRHIQLWGNDPPSIPSMPVWITNMNKLRDYALCRPSYLRSHLMEYFALPDTFRLEIPAIDTSMGVVEINGMRITDNVYSGVHFGGLPIKLTAVPKLGFRFREWQPQEQDAEIDFILSNDTTLVPVFETDLSGTELMSLITSNLSLTENTVYYCSGDLIVDSNAVLTVPEGVTIQMNDNACIIVYGGLRTTGTENNPVQIVPNPNPISRIPWFNEHPRWGGICIQSATDSSVFNHLLLEGASFGRDRMVYPAAISSDRSSVVLDNVTIQNSLFPVYTTYGSVFIRNCTMEAVLSGDIINIKYADTAIVEGCSLKGNTREDTDAIDFDGTASGAIRNNKIWGFFGPNSDGIDLGEGATNVRIEGNEIFSCSDKAISIGQASNAMVTRNLIQNCAQGVGIKDSGSFATIDQNTFYGNEYGIACFEKNPGRGGGEVLIQNTIFSNSRLSAVWIDEKSTGTVTYSLSEKYVLDGIGNLQTDPKFVRPGNNNFELQPESPCINSGNPSSPLDPDSSCADMGAYYRFIPFVDEYMIVNEINYQAYPLWNAGDWFEVCNTGTDTLSLKNWIICDENRTDYYRIDKNILIPSGGYHVFCTDSIRFHSIYPNCTNYSGNLNFGLGRKDDIQIFNNQQYPIHSLQYNTSSQWPDNKTASPRTLELADPVLDNNSGTNWQISYVDGGTPGVKNSESKIVDSLYINEIMAANTHTNTDEYGQYDDWIELFYSGSGAIDIAGIYLTDNSNKPMKWQIPYGSPQLTTIPAGGHLLLWADNDSSQGPLHIGFRLSSLGESVALFQITINDTLLIDSMSFSEQSYNVSFGRYPDGATNQEALYPTPKSDNLRITNPDISQIIQYPNPCSDKLFISIPYLLNHSLDIKIHNLIGQIVRKNVTIEQVSNNTLCLYLKSIPSGIYVLKIINEEQVWVKEFVIAR